jgi:type IV pilus assembly protein PilY1
VTAALIVGGAVTFSTNRPIPPDSASCAAPLGQARGYWVSLFNASGAIGVEGNCGGERSSPFLNDGLPPTPVFAQSVIVGDKIVSALLGAIPKGEEPGIKSSIEGRKHKPKITTKRKRTYTITSGD